MFRKRPVQSPGIGLRQPAPFYQWVQRLMPNPGNAMSSAFESEMLAWKPLIGPAIGQRFQFATIPPTPLNVQLQSLGVLNGLGGVNHGQNVLQPLVNPYTQE
jgi:hypothetical protein